jgi:hypothetical protein
MQLDIIMLDRPLHETPELARIFARAFPLAQYCGQSIAMRHAEEREVMLTKNGRPAERTAGCYHESGHMVVAVCLGGIPIGMVIDQGDNARADRALFCYDDKDPNRNCHVLDQDWTWRSELLVTAAGAPAKKKYRKIAHQYLVGLDGAAGDISKFEFLAKLLERQNYEDWLRFLKEAPKPHVARFFFLLDKWIAGTKSQTSPEEFFKEADETPNIAAKLRQVGRMAIPDSPNGPLWRRFVQETKEMLDIGWVWRSVERLAASLNKTGKIDADEILDTMLEEANQAVDANAVRRIEQAAQTLRKLKEIKGWET